jgi:hypothetical protein
MCAAKSRRAQSFETICKDDLERTKVGRENNQAPNYLATLDSYALAAMPPWPASTNRIRRETLKHAGAVSIRGRRVAANVCRVPRRIQRIRIDTLWRPEDDFYWTAGVNDRIHRPFLFLRDKLVPTPNHARCPSQLMGENIRAVWNPSRWPR